MNSCQETRRFTSHHIVLLTTPSHAKSVRSCPGARPLPELPESRDPTRHSELEQRIKTRGNRKRGNNRSNGFSFAKHRLAPAKMAFLISFSLIRSSTAVVARMVHGADDRIFISPPGPLWESVAHDLTGRSGAGNFDLSFPGVSAASTLPEHLGELGSRISV